VRVGGRERPGLRRVLRLHTLCRQLREQRLFAACTYLTEEKLVARSL
jgi:hypothetical protein